jgi:hypothetical protein
MGNNPAAVLVTIGIVVETGSGPLSWSSLQKAAEREGLLTPLRPPPRSPPCSWARWGRGER